MGASNTERVPVRVRVGIVDFEKLLENEVTFTTVKIRGRSTIPPSGAGWKSSN